MRLYNTLTRKKEEFIPIEPGKVKMYGCGPTVYNFFHVGNARAFLINDILRRYLEFSGYDVAFAQNFTDIEDKIINRAAEEGISPNEVAEKYIAEYKTDAEGLNIRPPTIQPRATETMPQIIELIGKLIDKGNAYEVDGDVYYDVHSFGGYGKLSGQPLEALEEGARVEIGDKKRSPADFALWKTAKSNEPSWESPWGDGRPGWHIECSAMCTHFLGKTIDIHCGGIDLIFPHHENEIAQSEAASGKDFSKYWVHTGFLTIDNQKMSKSKNNFFTTREAAKVYGYEAIRFFLLSAHYRSPINYSEDSLKQSNAALDRLYSVLDNLTFTAENAETVGITDAERETLTGLEQYKKAFVSAMDDDLNTADAIAAIFDLTKALNLALADNPSREFGTAGIGKLRELTDVLGLLYLRKNDKLLENDVEILINSRELARKAKDFAQSDRIREQLKNMGVILEDTPLGVKWRKI
ncbi:MAG: cysteine--tRNA ligase [Oscillospiraceae bacterium]|jgi:cysteinyl-tRNA synthetase|nr:cysteine--tRNA ligase [Oscillospiraceae bacterium]